MATDLLGGDNDTTLTTLLDSARDSDISSVGGSSPDLIASTMATTMAMAANGHHIGGIDSMPCFKDLFAVLFECFSIISLGYLSCRFKLISSEAKDLGSYLTTFALPMVIFLNIAQMEFETINISFLFCMLIAKLFLFIVVTLLTLATSYPTNSGYAGALSILATQSNDFALGYPLIKSLYGERKPEMLSYLSLMAPIQLLILNPLGIIMLEYEKSKRRKSNNATNIETACRVRTSSATATQTSPGARTSDDNDNNDDDDGDGDISMSHKSSNNASKIDRRDNSRATVHRQSLVNILQSPSGNSTHGALQRQKSSDSRKNIKHLELIIPDRSIVALECGSETSIDTLADSDSNANFIDYGHSKSFTLPSPFECPPSPVKSRTALRSSTTRPKLLYILPSQVAQVDSFQETYQSLEECTCDRSGNKPVIGLGFLQALATNPLIIASVVALLVNLTHGPQLPKMITKTANTIAASFAAPALFVVGVSMQGKFELILRNPKDLLLSSVLVITKVLLLPSIMRTLALVILPHYVPDEEIPYLTDFSYLYGLLPTAPTACIIAKQYGVLTNVVSISMLLSTFMSAPLMLGTSVIINQTTIKSAGTVQDMLAQTIKISGSITLVLSLITLFTLWKVNKRISYVNFINTPEVICRRVANRVKASSTHLFSILLVLTQLVIGIGGFMWVFVDTTKLMSSGSGSKHFSGLDDSIPSTTTTTDSSSTAGWSAELLSDSSSMDDIMASRSMDSDPLADHMLPIKRGGLLIAPNAMGLGFKALCTMQYIFSSGGLIMAKFVILSVVVLTVAQIFDARRISARLTSFMMKVYAILGVGTVVWLVIESSHLKCLPSEASLPSWPVSQYLRLLYNILLLVTVVPLLSIMFRSENKACHKRLMALRVNRGRRNEVHDIDNKPRLAKRRFLTSSASLSSDTSSAMTSNTNLDSSPIIIGTQMNAPHTSINNDHHRHPLTSADDSSSVILDCRTLETKSNQILDEKSNAYDDDNNNNNGQLESHVVARQEPESETRNAGHHNDGHDVNNIPDEPSTPRQPPPPSPTSQTTTPLTTDNQTSPTEFNKYSILIVFMVVQVVLNLTSTIQMLNQVTPFGTFRLIELANVALDFGQGLLTFFVLGLTWIKQI